MDLVQIAINMTGARTAAAEARGVSAAVASTGTAAQAAGVQASAAGARGERMRRAWSTAGRVMRAGALAAGAGIAVLAFQTRAAVAQSTELAATTAGLHRNLGLTNQEGSRWAAVAKARGIDAKSLNMSFTTLSRNIAAGAEDNAAYADTFQKLGISQDEVRNGTKDFTGFVTRLADAFGEAKGGAERQALAQKLLGRGYQSMLPLFSAGADGMREQLEWADKYHVTMSGKVVKDNMDLVAAQRESKVAWLGIQQTLSAAVLPVLTDAHGEFQRLAAVISDPKLSDSRKLEILGRKISKAADMAFDAFTAMLPRLANRMGQAVPKIASAFASAFLSANAWGKLILGGWLIKKLGGAAVAGAIGSKVGGWIAAKALAKMGLTMGASAVGPSLVTAMAPVAGAAGLGLGPLLGAALLAALLAYLVIHRDEVLDTIKGTTNMRAMTPEEIAALESSQGRDIDGDGSVYGDPSVGEHGAAGASAGGKKRPAPRRSPLAASKTAGGNVVIPVYLDKSSGRELGRAILGAAELEKALA